MFWYWELRISANKELCVDAVAVAVAVAVGVVVGRGVVIWNGRGDGVGECRREEGMGWEKYI